MGNSELFTHFKNAMKMLCDEHLNAEIDEYVWEGDPYDWASDALCTISAEGCLPIDFYARNGNKLLEDACDIVLKASGVDVWYEWVNGGVVAIYD